MATAIGLVRVSTEDRPVSGLGHDDQRRAIAGWCARAGIELAAAQASVVRLVANGEVDGASVGDSETWVADDDGWSELSEGQRKPLLGSGRASPTPLCHPPVARLLICSDGVSTYVKWNDLLALLERDSADSPWQLADAARLPSGGLQDDLSLLHVRRLVAPRRGAESAPFGGACVQR